jgi:hypothetical protein
VSHDELVDLALVVAAQLGQGRVFGRMDGRMGLIRLLALAGVDASVQDTAGEVAPTLIGRLHLNQRLQVQLLGEDVGFGTRVRDVALTTESKG